MALKIYVTSKNGTVAPIDGVTAITYGTKVIKDGYYRDAGYPITSLVQTKGEATYNAGNGSGNIIPLDTSSSGNATSDEVMHVAPRQLTYELTTITFVQAAIAGDGFCFLLRDLEIWSTDPPTSL